MQGVHFKPIVMASHWRCYAGEGADLPAALGDSGRCVELGLEERRQGHIKIMNGIWSYPGMKPSLSHKQKDWLT